MNQLSLLHLPRLSPSPRRGHGPAVVRARLSSPETQPEPASQQRAGRLLLSVAPHQDSIVAAAAAAAAATTTEERDHSPARAAAGGRTCPLPAWTLIGGIAAGVGVALALSLSAGAGPALALGPEGPLVEEFWDNMRRYALYVVTVSTGVAYTVLQPIVELLKNPVTALLIVAVLAGSGFLVSQVLNAMVGNSDFIYRYE